MTTTLAERLERCLAERKELSKAGLARACKVAPPSVSNWFDGRTKRITGANLLTAARYLGVRPEWLASGAPPMRGSSADSAVSPVLEIEKSVSDYVRVAQLDGEADMGDGRVNDDYPEVVRSMEFTPAYIRAVVGFIPPPGRLVMVTGRGDSMLPVIQPGESLIVDTGVQTFDGDGIYLINTGNGQQVKGLQDRGDAVYVVSANAALYPAFPLPRGAVIGGKVYLRNRIDRLN